MLVTFAFLAALWALSPQGASCAPTLIQQAMHELLCTEVAALQIGLALLASFLSTACELHAPQPVAMAAPLLFGHCPNTVSGVLFL